MSGAARVLKLPRLARVAGAIVDVTGRPTRALQIFWDGVMRQIEAQEARQDTLLQAIVDAQNAAAAANTAAATAQTAATTAQDAADASSLSTSYVTGLTLSGADAGTDVTITISAHTRVYGDGTSVSVNGGTLTGKAYSTGYWIYYDQASRAGGTVSYQATTVQTDAAPSATNPDRHFVGAILTPAAAAPPTNGNAAKWTYANLI